MSQVKKLAKFGLGTGQMENATFLIDHAIQFGYQLFDCASIYGNEPECGRAFKDHRDNIYVISKVWNDDKGSKEAIKEACLKSLQELQLDVIDLYLIHW